MAQFYAANWPLFAPGLTLKRFGMLKPGSYQSLIWSVRGEERARIGIQAFADHLILIYKTRERGGEWQDIRDTIPLTFNTPNYGGRRAWFVCPSCGQRKGVLWGAAITAAPSARA